MKPIDLGSVDVTEMVKRVKEIRWKAGGPGTYAMAKVQDVPTNFPVWRTIVAAWMLTRTTPARPGLILWSRVVPGQHIKLHHDLESGCRARIHIPLTSNSKACFLYDGEASHMDVGHAYEIDPMVEHGVRNDGDSDRIHFFFEAL